MDLKDYVKGALRTESIINQVEVSDVQRFFAVLAAFVASAQLLDMYKKNVFYKKPIKQEKFDDASNNLSRAADFLTVQEYPVEAFPSKTLEINPRILHGIIGVATETGELVEAIIKHFENKPLDNVNVAEEIGDVCWYQAILIDTLDAEWEQILERNLAKLKIRYPEKFTNEHAIDRDLNKERQILEGKE